jgi:hypothetical protein
MRTRALQLLVLAVLLPAVAWAKLDEAGLKRLQAATARPAAEQGPLLEAAKAAYEAGASVAELEAFFKQTVKAPAAEQLRGLGEMKGLLDEGLSDQEARRSAVLALEARLKGAKAGSRGIDVLEAKRDKDAARRRDEQRERMGREDKAVLPTPVVK